MSKKIPQDWELVPLKEFCTGIRGVAYSPTDLHQSRSDQTVTLLRSNNIQSGGLTLGDVQYVDSSRVKSIQIAKRDDIAVCMSNGSKRLVGKSAVFTFDSVEKFTVGAFCSIYRPVNGVKAGFVKQLFKSDFFQRQVDFSLAGSAINNLKNSDIEDYIFLKPPIEEQQKIASILTAVDVVIESTTAQINKLKDLKTGMMQELLTKGIGHTEFKDSPVGRIPKAWEVGVMRDICSVRQGLQIPISNRFRTRGENRFPYLTIRFINSGFDEAVAEFIESPNVRVVCKSDDILLARTGATGTVVTGVNGVFHNNFFMVDYFRERVSRIFLYQYLNSPYIQTEIANRAGTTTIPDLNHGDFYSLPMLIPPIHEQTKIADILSDVDSKLIVMERKYLTLQNTKKGLMQDLLTGKIRVNTGNNCNEGSF